MPEGDTLYKLAAALRPMLLGQPLVAAESRYLRLPALRGRAAEGIESRGKHLWIEFGALGGLRTHLGLYGTWHRYRPGARWKRPVHRAAVVLTTRSDVVVCFHPKEIVWWQPESARRRALDRHLGPDLITESLTRAVLESRLAHFAQPTDTLAEVLLDQRIAAGIGNVFKSEVLFLAGQDPSTPLAAIDSDTLLTLYHRAQPLLRANCHPGPRITRPARDGGYLWVYGRAGDPCYQCRTPIRYTRGGRGHRSTYWCPSCQSDHPPCSPVEPPYRRRG